MSATALAHGTRAPDAAVAGMMASPALEDRGPQTLGERPSARIGRPAGLTERASAALGIPVSPSMMEWVGRRPIDG